jgi:hypothetical protein
MDILRTDLGFSIWLSWCRFSEHVLVNLATQPARKVQLRANFMHMLQHTALALKKYSVLFHCRLKLHASASGATGLVPITFSVGVLHIVRQLSPERSVFNLW